MTIHEFFTRVGRRSLSPLAVPLLAISAACGPEAPALPVDSDEFLTVNDLQAEKAIEFVVGPVDLPADGPHIRLPIQMTSLPFDGWMHGFEWDLRTGQGDPVPPDLLHHVNLIDPDSRELFTPISRRVLAAGRETQSEKVPGILGYPLADGQRMLIAAMFGNPTGEDYEDVYLHFRILYSRAGEGVVRPREVFPFYMDVMGFTDVKDFPVPPGRSEMSYTASPAIDARILGIGGHVHDYATELRLEDATTGEVLWSEEPEIDEAGRVTGVPSGRFWLTGGKRIYKDRDYRIVVVYDNPLDRPAPDGGMGAIGGIVTPVGDAQWPEFDQSAPDYITDLRNTLTAPERMAAQGHGHHGGGTMPSGNAEQGDDTESEGDAHGGHVEAEVEEHGEHGAMPAGQDDEAGSHGAGHDEAADDN